MPPRVELVDPAEAEVGEAPTWDEETNTLTWVDITRGVVHISDEAGERVAVFEAGAHVGAALPAMSGGWLLAVRDGFRVLHPDGRVTSVLDVDPRPTTRFNDAKCDPRGRAFAGTMSYDEQPGCAALYRLDPGPSATTLLEGLGLSNGMGWSPDQRRFYFIDSLTQSVQAFDYDPDSGTIENPVELLTIGDADGMPDGMCVDDEGCLWIAMMGGGAICRYSPRGRLDKRIPVPVRQVTSVGFGGAHRDILYITTARYRMTPEQIANEPLAGGLFAVNPGTAGPPATKWTLDA